MRAERPRGHGPIVERLWQAARAGRLPHALLLRGPRGAGKFLAATWFAAGLLCRSGPGEPCGSCGPCKRVTSGAASGNHPDLLVLDPLERGEEQIRIVRIARRTGSEGADLQDPSLEEFLDLVPHEGGMRAVLIREAHRMNAAAQNALLKRLEEPRPRTCIVAETHRPDLLLDTVKSRCVEVVLPGLSPGECAQVLEEAGLEEGQAGRLARWAEGSPGVALELSRRGAEEARGLLAELLKCRRDPLDAARELWELPGDFPGKTPQVAARERARSFLDLAGALVRDLQRRACGAAADGLPHGDLVDELGSEGRGAGELRDLALTLSACRADVDRNLAPETTLERACLALAPGDSIIPAPWNTRSASSL